MQRRGFLKHVTLGAAVAAAFVYGPTAFAQSTVKVGILHSL